MKDKPAPTYQVSVLEKQLRRTVLTTTDIAEAFAKAKEIGDNVRVDVIDV